MRRSVVALALMLAACSAPPPPEASEKGDAFDPIAFFTGASHGEATLDQIFKDERHVSVESAGRLGGDGTLKLEQKVMVAGEPPRTRSWRLRRAGPGRYVGMLTDASGPVEAQAVGRAIRLRYPMKGGLQVEQWLMARDGGQTLDNRLSVTKWGIGVATLHERIVKRSPDRLRAPSRTLGSDPKA